MMISDTLHKVLNDTLSLMKIIGNLNAWKIVLGQGSQGTGMTAALRGSSRKVDSRTWDSFTRSGLRLGWKPPHTDILRKGATTVTFLISSHSWIRDNISPKSSFHMEANIFHLEITLWHFCSLWWYGVSCNLLVWMIVGSLCERYRESKGHCQVEEEKSLAQKYRWDECCYKNMSHCFDTEINGKEGPAKFGVCK